MSFSYGQTLGWVYSNKKGLEEIEQIFEDVKKKEDLILVDSNSMGKWTSRRTFGILCENGEDCNVIDQYPKIYKHTKHLFIACGIPENLWKFHKLKSFRIIESSVCSGRLDLSIFFQNEITRLKNLKTVSFQQSEPYLILEKLAGLKGLKEFNVNAMFYPFTILTNRSVNLVGISSTYPETEMFRQLGYYIDGGFGRKFQLDFEIPQIPKQQMRKGEFHNGKLNLYYSNGNSLVEGQLSSEKLDGNWRLWYANGNLCESRFYHQGKPDGQWIFLKENGDTLCLVDHQNNEPFQLTLTNRSFDSLLRENTYGQSVTTNYLHPDIAVSKGFVVKVGPTDSTVVEFESIGGIKKSDVKRKFDKQSILIQEILFIGYENGNLENPITKGTSYYQNGQKKEESHLMWFWVNGNYVFNYHGKSRKWDEFGNLIFEVDYNLGQVKN